MLIIPFSAMVCCCQLEMFHLSVDIAGVRAGAIPPVRLFQIKEIPALHVRPVKLIFPTKTPLVTYVVSYRIEAKINFCRYDRRFILKLEKKSSIKRLMEMLEYKKYVLKIYPEKVVVTFA